MKKFLSAVLALLMVLTVLPSIIIFVLLQKYIVEGVVAGAVKG